MTRAIGIAFIFLFCILTGNNYAESFYTEYKDLCRLCDMLFDIKYYIENESMTLGEILKELGVKEEYSVFTFISHGSDLPDIREALLIAIKKGKPFKNNEYNDRVYRLFRLIGTTDKQTLVSLIESNIVYFESQADMLRKELSVKKRLYNSLGVAFGALLSIILL